jgi:hypothetical protein
MKPASPPEVAATANLFFGAGYALLGQKRKAVLAAVAQLIGHALPFFIFNGIFSWLLMFVALNIPITAAIDAYLQAEQLEQGKPIGQWTWFRRHL